MQLVIEHTGLGDEPRRAVIVADALSAHEARGWVAIGETTDPYREPICTDAEWLDIVAAAEAKLAALAAPKTDDAPAPSRPRK